MDFGFCLPIPFTLPLPVPSLSQCHAHCCLVVSGVVQGHRRRPVMTGKGSKITQGQRYSGGRGGAPPLWPLLPTDSLKGSGERLLSRKLGATVERGPMAPQLWPQPWLLKPSPPIQGSQPGLLPGKLAGHFFTHLENNSPSWFPAFSRRG